MSVKAQKINCPVCDASDFKVRLKSSPAGRIVHCKNCKVYYANPRNIEDLIETKEDGDKFKKLFADQIPEFPWRKKTFLDRLEKIEKHFPEKGRILDIGCYSGLFLWLAEIRGWETYGVEPTKAGAEFAKDVFNQKVVRGTLSDSDFAKESFDVITLFHTVEHLPNPKAVIKDALKLLKSGGMIFIETPDAGSVWFKILGRKWRQCIIDHFILFNKKSLVKILKEENMEIGKKKSVGRQVRLGLIDYRISQYYSQLIGKIIERFLKLFRIKNKTVNINLGDVMWVEARK
ncbi:MAG: class I SAM-dependent methyltransferase [bacterium]